MHIIGTYNVKMDGQKAYTSYYTYKQYSFDQL